MHTLFKNILSPRLHFIPISLLILFGFLVYQNSLTGGFIWDDNVLIKGNISIRSWNEIFNVFIRPLHISFSGYYRPMQNISYMLDYYIWKLNPFGYHLTNITLHLFNASLLYLLFLHLFQNRISSFLSTALFSVHTILSEPVNYISSRSILLVTSFIILSFIFYLKSNETGKIKIYFNLSLLFFIFSLLSNEIALILPMLLFVYCFLFRESYKKILPYVFLVCLYILLRNCVVPTLLIFQKLPKAAFIIKALSISLQLVLIPTNLQKNWIISQPITINTLLTGILFFLCLLKLFFSNKKAFFGIFWFTIVLLSAVIFSPTSNFILSEGWFYFPSIGCFISLTVFFNYMLIHKAIRYIGIILISLVIITYSLLTFGHNKIWINPVNFYKVILSKSKSDDKIWANLGGAFAENRNFHDAIYSYKMALSLNPNNLVALNGIGAIYFEQHLFTEALGYFQKAINIFPCYAESLHNIATIYLIQNKTNLAIEFYKKSLICSPDNIDSLYNLAILFAKNGENEKALEIIKKFPQLKKQFNITH